MQESKMQSSGYLAHTHIICVYGEMEVFDDEFMGLLVEMNGKPHGELKTNLWSNGNGTNQTIYTDTTLFQTKFLYMYPLPSGILPQCKFQSLLLGSQCNNQFFNDIIII